MPRLRLPPLPVAKEWANVFPRGPNARSTSSGTNIREGSKRLHLTNRSLADKFVQALGIREGEVVVDCYAAIGLVTRSLLAGGFDETTAADWARTKKELGNVGPRAGQVKRRNIGQFDFPEWNVESVPDPELPTLPTKITVPALVVANDPSIALLSRGFGFDPDQAPPSKWELNDPQTTERLPVFEQFSTVSNTQELMSVYPSVIEPNLVFSPTTMYLWASGPRILSHPLVYSKMPIYDSSREGAEATMRPWTAPEPPITFVVTMPQSTLGEQMISQWISSAIGSVEFERSWIWKWGRIRIALLASKGIYDRLLARPGESIYCKLSVMAQALFEISPLPPYHHVPDVDKHSIRTSTEAPPDKKSRTTRPAPPPTDEITVTCQGDFHPLGRGKDPKAILPRPNLLGVKLVPRKHSLVQAEQRDVWDYILRKSFVREASTFGDTLPSLAFGAENLIKKIEEIDSVYLGEALYRHTPVRNITVEQWARVVDVFDKWAFKPDMLILDSRVEQEDNREVGSS